MNLIQAEKILKGKEKNRNKLLGQKEMLTANLNDFGFVSVKNAKKELEKMKVKLEKMNEHYANGEKIFKNKFEHLLHP
jgi:superfamily II RNA helicase